MSKGAYIGVNNVAHKIKKGYIGIDGVARRIKKAYIGIGGVARPCWSGGELVYYGRLTDIDVYACKGDSTNEYAIFSGLHSTIYAYSFDKYLTLTQKYSDHIQRSYATAASVGDYVLFAGGTKSNGESSYNVYYSRVEAINNSLTLIMAPNLNGGKSDMTGTRFGNYALFGGGSMQSSEGMYLYNVGEVYDAKLTKINTSVNFGHGGGSACTTLGQYAISGGGSTINSSYRTTYACDLSLTNIPINELTDAKEHLNATSVGNYALFAGGGTWSGGSVSAQSTTVDVYDNKLTKITDRNLSSVRLSPGAETLEDYAIFFGGTPNRQVNFDDKITYEIYDSYLVHRTNSIDVSLHNWKCIDSACIGNYAIFAGDGYYTKYPNIFTLR